MNLKVRLSSIPFIRKTLRLDLQKSRVRLFKVKATIEYIGPFLRKK